MERDYTLLNIETTYSFFKSNIKIDDLILFCKNNNLTSIGINDVDNLYAFPSFNKKCKENNITPYFGVKFNIENIYISFFLKNEIGYRALIKLSNKINEIKHKLNIDYISIFEFKDIFSLLDESEVDSIISIISISYNEFNKINFKDKLIKIFKILNNKFYIGIDERIKENIYLLIKELKELTSLNLNFISFPLIKNDLVNNACVLELLKAIENNEILDINDFNNSIYLSFNLLTIEEYFSIFSDFNFININTLFKDYDFNLNIIRSSLIDYPKFLNLNISSDELLKNNILESLKDKNIDLNKFKNYRDRLNYEYKIIKDMGYSNYFLIVEDYVKYAKNNNILVGPGRGSASGSLIAYLLGITEIDPIKYNLLFERFLNPNRNSMPDIDVDFQDIKRDDIIHYLENKYGSNKVSRIIAFQSIKAKNAIRDVCRVFNYPVKIADLISKEIEKTIEESKNKELTLSECLTYDSFKTFKDSTIDYSLIIDYALKIEGLIRQKGIHAAGIIISNNSLNEVLPLNYIENNESISQYEKDYLEDEGLLKFDLLGLSNLTTIQNTINFIKLNHDYDIDFSKIPLNDKKVYELINKGYLLGLFQTDTKQGKSAIKDIKPTNFKAIVDSISLTRPGPNSFIKNYVKRMNNQEKITYYSPCLEKILKPTYGIIIYQEQIMRIAQVYSSFSFSEADLLRRAISKKHKEELLNLKRKFILGAIKNKHTKEESLYIFNVILKFSNYGFNESHAVSYATITIRMAYLKTYFPKEFYAASLNIDTTNKFNDYLIELKKRNIKIISPNINLAESIFYPSKSGIIFPLTSINSINQKLSFDIINERKKNGPYLNFKNFIERTSTFESKLNEKNLSYLIDAGCFDSFKHSRKQYKQVIPDALLLIKNSKAGLYIDDSIDFYYKDTLEEDKIQNILNEINSIGISLSDSILNHVLLTQEEKNKLTSASSLIKNKNAFILGIIKSVKIIKDKTKKDMAFLNILTNEDYIEGTIFSDIYLKHQEIIKEGNIVYIEGYKKNYKDNDEKIYFIIKSIKKVNLYE